MFVEGDPAWVLTRLTADLFASITQSRPQEAVSDWMARWVVAMYEPGERTRLPQILTEYAVANHGLLQRIFDDPLVRRDRLADYLAAPATLAIFERLSSKPMTAAYIWRQGLGTPQDLADLAALVGVGL